MEKKTTKRNSEKPFNLYGVRFTRNDKYMSVTLVRGESEKEWLNVPVKTDYVKVKDGYGYIKLRLLEQKAKERGEDCPF